MTLVPTGKNPGRYCEMSSPTMTDILTNADHISDPRGYDHNSSNPTPASLQNPQPPQTVNPAPTTDPGMISSMPAAPESSTGPPSERLATQVTIPPRVAVASPRAANLQGGNNAGGLQNISKANSSANQGLTAGTTKKKHSTAKKSKIGSIFRLQDLVRK